MSPSYAKRAAMTHRVAIVGAGPSGFYAADGLLRANPDLHIDIIDRLPTPHGLMRAGVAPDHQGTKAVARQFDRLLARPDVRFAGNIEIGRDLSWDELITGYDAIIVATGMVIDRKLGVPGEDLAHVWGSWRFVGWLNGHPDFRQGPDLSKVRSVAVIGNGNVALDVARVLAKSADEMAKSDIVPEAGAAIAAAPLTDIHVIGRRGPEHASFTNNELAEMGRLSRAVAVTERQGAGRGAAGVGSDARAAAQGQEPGDPAGLCQQQAGQQAGHGAFPLSCRAGGVQAGRGRTHDRQARRRSGRDLHRLHRRGLPQARGGFPGGLGQARARPARSRPTAPRATPWPRRSWPGWRSAIPRAGPTCCRSPSTRRAGTASTSTRSRPAPPMAGLA